MTTESDKLRQMIDRAPEQVDNLNNSIAQVEDIQDEVNEEIDAVQGGLCDVSEADLVDYLENTKKAAVGGDAVTYGPDFGTIDFLTGGITDWSIDSTAVPIYEYLGVGWDGDATITKLITDYAFGNDYLSRPLDSGASYGLIPYESSLQDGVDLLTENKDKVEDSITAFEDYAT